MDDGHYVIGVITFAIAAFLCAAPVLGPGLLVFVIQRARMRQKWTDDHRAKGVDAAWLRENSRRFG